MKMKYVRSKNENLDNAFNISQIQRHTQPKPIQFNLQEDESELIDMSYNDA